jgi:hypothetical protein
MVCSGCGSTGPFYSSISRWCKECWKAKVRSNRDARLSYYRAYDRARGRRGESQPWGEKRAARQRALRAHPVPQPCSRCGATENTHRHHPRYSEPETIVWFCAGCHGREHAQERKAA